MPSQYGASEAQELRPHPFDRLRAGQRLRTIARMELDDCEFELRYEDYSQSCRAVGIEPLTLEALQKLIDALTEKPQPSIH